MEALRGHNVRILPHRFNVTVMWNMNGVVISGLTCTLWPGRQRCKPSLISVLKGLICPGSGGRAYGRSRFSPAVYRKHGCCCITCLHRARQNHRRPGGRQTPTRPLHYSPSLPNQPVHTGITFLDCPYITLYCSFYSGSKTPELFLCTLFYV